MPTFAKPRLLLLGLLVVVLAASCSGGGNSKPAAPAPSGSPGEVAVGLDKKSLQRRQLELEGLLASCMKAKGFDYVPLDPTATPRGRVVVQGLTDEEFRSQYGYGISTLYDAAAKPGAKGVTSNPNVAIRDALSPADRTAYDKAFTGGSSEATFASAVDNGDFSSLGGCTREATEKVFGGTKALQTVQSALDEVDKRVAADKRVTAAQRQWASCMRQAGFEYQEGDEIEASLTKRLEAIVGPPGGRKATYDKPALASLQENELKLAQTDAACEAKFLKPVKDKVEVETEAAVVAAHPELANNGAR
jgi:hypothetical protein